MGCLKILSNHFKSVNDEYGHAAGDKTLKRFARILCDSFKEDTVDIGRWGGEEFVAVCYNKTLDEAVKMAEKFRIAIADASMSHPRNITCSAGVTEVKEGDKFEDAFGRMDKALYEAKSGGRNRVVAG